MSRFDLDIDKTVRALEMQLEAPTRDTTLGELFNADFMSRFTDFKSIDELFQQSGFKVSTLEDIKSIPIAEFNDHIASTTKFASWEEMWNAAGAELIKQRLGR